MTPPSQQEQPTAEAEGTDLTAPPLVRDALADRRLFALDDAAWTEFLAALDRPVLHKPRLKKLLVEPTIFDDGVNRSTGTR